MKNDDKSHLDFMLGRTKTKQDITANELHVRREYNKDILNELVFRKVWRSTNFNDFGGEATPLPKKPKNVTLKSGDPVSLAENTDASFKMVKMGLDDKKLSDIVENVKSKVIQNFDNLRWNFKWEKFNIDKTYIYNRVKEEVSNRQFSSDNKKWLAGNSTHVKSVKSNCESFLRMENFVKKQKLKTDDTRNTCHALFEDLRYLENQIETLLRTVKMSNFVSKFGPDQKLSMRNYLLGNKKNLRATKNGKSLLGDVKNLVSADSIGINFDERKYGDEGLLGTEPWESLSKASPRAGALDSISQ
jgi:hypothetical protein